MNELSKGVPALVPMKIVSHHNTSLVPRPSYLLRWKTKAWYTCLHICQILTLIQLICGILVHICVFITCTCTSTGAHKGKERSIVIYRKPNCAALAPRHDIYQRTCIHEWRTHRRWLNHWPLVVARSICKTKLIHLSPRNVCIEHPKATRQSHRVLHTLAWYSYL